MPGAKNLIGAVAFPRGVADPEADLACFENLAGFVEGIELVSGKRRWRSPVAGEPVFAARGFVIVVRPPQACRLEAETGRLLDEHVLPLDLPPVAEPSNVQFTAHLRGDLLGLEWRADGRYSGGAPVPDEIRRGFERRFGGVIEWDLRTGALRTGAAGTAPTEDDLPSWPYRQRGVWRERAWRCGELTLRLAADESRTAGQESISLQRAEGGALRSTGPSWAPPIEPTVTPDGCHLLVRRTAPPAGPWEVVDVRAARELARVPYREGSQFPAIIGARLFFMTAPRPGSPAALHAVDLASCTEVWQLTLDPPMARGAPPLPRSGPAP